MCLILIDKFIDILNAHITISFKNQMVLNVFEYVIVDILENVGSFDPLLFIFFVKIAFKHPETAITLNLLTFRVPLLLLF